MGPAVTHEWSAVQLAAAPEAWTHELSAAEVEALGEAAHALAARLTGASLLEAAPSHVARHLPPCGGERGELAGLCARTRASLFRGPGLFVLRGLPVAAWGVPASAAAFWLLGCAVGEAVPQNRQGHCLGHVRDTGGDPAQPATRLYTTSAAQPFHTDSADVVGLLCLAAADEGGASHVCSSASVYAALLASRPDLAAVLTRPFIVDRKGEVPAGKGPTYEAPVFGFSGQEGCSDSDSDVVATARRRAPAVVSLYDRSFIRAALARPGAAPLSAEQAEALDAADRLAASDDLRLDMHLRPGDVQLLHSHTTWHARGAFRDALGGGGDGRSRRHLLRLWLAARGGDAWPLPPFFAERFGTVAAGGDVPRGGIRVPGQTLVAPLVP